MNQPPDEEAIFLAALEKQGQEERQAFVEVACADRPDLLERVRELLHSYGESIGPLDVPIAGINATLDQPITEKPGTQIGPYKLLQQIGEGGMGVVYLAEQREPVKRRVALKIIKPGMDTRQVIARFEAERQALAMMDHPNIAKVLDAGATDSGRPYFVMELVNGLPVTTYCDEQRLTPLERLELFVPICHGVQHAHQKGIIHRDIKPGNILVALYDGQAVPKIIDFGVAKATSQTLTEKTMFTQLGQVVGTLEYMSPEQSERNQQDIDTRSDIYSLGVVLYELLTGETPFDRARLRSAAFDEVLRIMREEEPSKPSTKVSSSLALPAIAAKRRMEPAKLGSLIRGELDWIVMKALDKDRARRYETANGLAGDVQRYLNDEPVVACPPSASYRFSKFARRNKTSLATVALVALALILGLVGTTWQWFRATWEAQRAFDAESLAESRYENEKMARQLADAARASEERGRAAAEQASRLAREKELEAVAARDSAQVQRQRAEQNFSLARRAVDEFLSRVTESELLSVPGLQPLREDLLSSALVFYEQFIQEQADDDSLVLELAAAHSRLASIHVDLRNHTAFRDSNEEAIRLFEQLLSQGKATHDVKIGLAKAYFSWYRRDDARKLCQEILQAEPDHVGATDLLAEVFNVLGSNASRHNLDESLNYHQQAFQLRKSLVERFPDNPRYLAALAGTLNNLAVLLARQDKTEQALAMYERSVEYAAQAYELAPHSIEWGRLLCVGIRNIAESQEKLERPEEALAAYQRLVDIRRKRAFENPAVAVLRVELCQAHLYLAHYQRKLGNTAESERSFRAARETLEMIARDSPHQLYELATVYAALGQPQPDAATSDSADVAEQQHNLNLAIETLRKAVDAGFDDEQTVQTNALFDPLRDREDFQQLLARLAKFAQARKLATQYSRDDNQKLADRKRAAQLLKELPQESRATVGHQRTLAAVVQSIGVIQTDLKQFTDAEVSLQEAITSWRSMAIRQPDKAQQWVLNRIESETALGNLYFAGGRGADAHRIWQSNLGELQLLAAQHSAYSGETHHPYEYRIYRNYGRLGVFSIAADYAQRNLERLRPQYGSSDLNASIAAAIFDGGDALRAACLRVDQNRIQWGGLNWFNSEVQRLAQASNLLNPPALSPELTLQWMTQIAAADPGGWNRAVLALAQYRAGNSADAIRTLNEPPTDGDFTTLDTEGSHLVAAFVYALAHQQLGHVNLARQHLNLAERLWESICRESLTSNDVGLVAPFDRSPFDFVAAQMIRREAWREVSGQAANESLVQLLQARALSCLGEQEQAEKAFATAVSQAESAGIMEPENSRQDSHGDALFWALKGRVLADLGRNADADDSFARAVSDPRGRRPALAVAPFSSNDAAELQRVWAEHLGLPIEWENSLGMRFRLIPPGRFQMGTPPEVRAQIVKQLREEGLANYLVTPHGEEGYAPVFLTTPYYLGVHEVTVGQFRKFVDETAYVTDGERMRMGGFAARDGWKRDPSHIWKSPDRAWVISDDQPVVHMGHQDALAFCKWLSKREQVVVGLPSEAQWEFACRAGTESLYGVGDSPESLEQVAWTKETLSNATKMQAQAVGIKLANPFGLHDMLGNVWEHCRNGYAPGLDGTIPQIDPDPPLRVGQQLAVGRGGAWYRPGYAARCGHRVPVTTPDPNDAGFGFRVAITADLSQVKRQVSSRDGTTARSDAVSESVETPICCQTPVIDDPIPETPGTRISP